MAVDSLDSAEKAGEPDVTDDVKDDVREAATEEEQLKATLDGAWQQLEVLFNEVMHPGQRLTGLIACHFQIFARGQLACPAIHASWRGTWNTQTSKNVLAFKSGR
ncbi:wdhd1 [Symbiodinium sp. CCMP2592]|nr:wdhd1 [Symbiodinium sp. CCMP2592]